ncbi:MAG TPA: DNA-directed RNA polymerase subunit omega, partial [Blastocatellia bacterium]|nr:DNA-directed RNA polymerase subunit omega [Blastocatellia bacterium]
MARIRKAIEAVGNPYTLCVLLARRGKQLHRRFDAGNCSMARSFERVLDEIFSGELRFALPTERQEAEGAETRSRRPPLRSRCEEARSLARTP